MITFRYVSERHRGIVVPANAPRTQLDNAKALKQLLAFFDDLFCPLKSIEPQDIRQCIMGRSDTAKVRANLEEALLSYIWDWARLRLYELGQPMRRHQGQTGKTGRDVHVEDDAFDAV